MLKMGGSVLGPGGSVIRHVPVGPWPDRPAAEREEAFLSRIRTAPAGAPQPIDPQS